MKPFVVITDPGIDDLIALLLLYKLAPKFKNTIISSFGNVPESNTFENAREFIATAGLSWQLMHGSALPLRGMIEHHWPYYFHGPDGVWSIHNKIDCSGVKIIEKLAEVENVISLAPLTDLYKLSEKFNKKIKKIVAMGGVFYDEGNETVHAETNIAFDPDAACLFFAKHKDISVSIVPLDVTRKVYWSEEMINAIGETNIINTWIKEILRFWNKRYSHEREEQFNLHDPLAVYLTFFPEKADWIQEGVEVETLGKKRGKTKIGRYNPKCKIAVRLKKADTIAEEIFKIAFL